ncbi:MAG: HEAT repeat domain-containing protein, partial [Planctomycetota bacterium]
MSQGWDAWWHWSRNEFLIPQRQPLTDPQGRARSELSSILITQLRSGNAIVRSAAVRALGRVGGHGTVRHLLAQLRDPVLEVREDAILALGTTGRAAAVHALLHIARCGCAPGQGSPGTDAQVISSQSRTLAVLALALARRYGSHLDLDRLIRNLPVKIKNTKTDPAQHKHRDLAMAKLLYATLVNSTEMQALSRQLADARQVSLDLRCRALESLCRAGDDASLDVLARATRGTKLEARRSAALALGTIRHPGAMAEMFAAHQQEHEHLTRAFLLISIGRQGGAKARRFLVNSIRTGPKTLRPWAALGLGLAARQQATDVDADLVDALRAAYRAEKSHHARGAYLIALGLARDVGSLPEIDRNLYDAR